MIVPTAKICGVLSNTGFSRDDSQLYGYAGYCGDNGECLVIDESYAFQDTDHLIEDCIANGCYGVAATIKTWVEKQTKKDKG